MIQGIIDCWKFSEKPSTVLSNSSKYVIEKATIGVIIICPITINVSHKRAINELRSTDTCSLQFALLLSLGLFSNKKKAIRIHLHVGQYQIFGILHDGPKNSALNYTIGSPSVIQSRKKPIILPSLRGRPRSGRDF